jgi:hypothetical protein
MEAAGRQRVFYVIALRNKCNERMGFLLEAEVERHSNVLNCISSAKQQREVVEHYTNLRFVNFHI